MARVKRSSHLAYMFTRRRCSAPRFAHGRDSASSCSGRYSRAEWPPHSCARSEDVGELSAQPHSVHLSFEVDSGTPPRLRMR
jgi:hypothetical protein